MCYAIFLVVMICIWPVFERMAHATAETLQTNSGTQPEKHALQHSFVGINSQCAVRLLQVQPAATIGGGATTMRLAILYGVYTLHNPHLPILRVIPYGACRGDGRYYGGLRPYLLMAGVPAKQRSCYSAVPRRSIPRLDATRRGPASQPASQPANQPASKDSK